MLAVVTIAGSNLYTYFYPHGNQYQSRLVLYELCFFHLRASARVPALHAKVKF